MQSPPIFPAPHRGVSLPEFAAVYPYRREHWGARTRHQAQILYFAPLPETADGLLHPSWSWHSGLTA